MISDTQFVSVLIYKGLKGSWQVKQPPEKTMQVVELEKEEVRRRRGTRRRRRRRRRRRARRRTRRRCCSGRSRSAASRWRQQMHAATCNTHTCTCMQHTHAHAHAVLLFPYLTSPYLTSYLTLGGCFCRALGRSVDSRHAAPHAVTRASHVRLVRLRMKAANG